MLVHLLVGGSVAVDRVEHNFVVLGFEIPRPKNIIGAVMPIVRSQPIYISADAKPRSFRERVAYRIFGLNVDWHAPYALPVGGYSAKAPTLNNAYIDETEAFFGALYGKRSAEKNIPCRGRAGVLKCKFGCDALARSDIYIRKVRADIGTKLRHLGNLICSDHSRCGFTGVLHRFAGQGNLSPYQDGPDESHEGRNTSEYGHIEGPYGHALLCREVALFMILAGVGGWICYRSFYWFGDERNVLGFSLVYPFI